MKSTLVDCCEELVAMSITAVGPSGAPRATAVEDRIELVEPSGRTLSLSLQKSDLAEDQRIGALLFMEDGTLVAGCARGRVHAFAQHGDLKFSRQFVPCGPISAIKRWPNNELAILHEDAVCLLRRADDDHLGDAQRRRRAEELAEVLLLGDVVDDEEGFWAGRGWRGGRGGAGLRCGRG